MTDEHHSPYDTLDAPDPDDALAALREPPPAVPVSLEKRVPAEGPPAPVKKRGRPIHRFAFHGTGGALFGTIIVNYFLTVLTLGVYSFWGKAKVRRYTHSCLELKGQRFAYHGTGGELFKGFLRAMGLYLAITAAAGATYFATKSEALAMLMVYGGLIPFMPWAIVGSRKYMTSRTSLFGIRFSYRGDVKGFTKVFLKELLLCVVTLGFYSPYATMKVRNHLIENTWFGNRRFESTCDGKALFKPYVTAFFLHVPTLGLVWLWYAAKSYRYTAEQTRWGKVQFRSEVRGRDLIGLQLTNMLLLMVTLGLAYPWVLARTMQFNAKNIFMLGDLDLDSLKQEVQLSGYGGEGMAEFLDVGVDMGFAV